MKSPGQDSRGGDAPPPLPGGSEWLRAEGSASDVVISSRARLARNLAGVSFVGKAKKTDRQESLDRCRSWLLQAGIAERVSWVDLHLAPPLARTLLVERHLISKQHSKGRGVQGVPASDEPRGVCVSVPDERLSIMVNEEDHLRIQVMRSGLGLTDCWAQADEVDDKIEAGLDYAYSPRFGYLTACPTNVGTGLRMSVMLHLPGLRLTGEIEKVKRAAADTNLAVRGFYGEGSESAGDFYQISNQTTLGKTETRIIAELENEIIPQVVEYERVSRRTLLSKRRMSLEDQVFRSLGVLQNARLLTTEEAMTQLSFIRLGVVLGLMSGVDSRTVGQMMMMVHPAHLQDLAKTELDQDQRRTARASLLRTQLAGVKAGC